MLLVYSAVSCNIRLLATLFSAALYMSWFPSEPPWKRKQQPGDTVASDNYAASFHLEPQRCKGRTVDSFMSKPTRVLSSAVVACSIMRLMISSCGSLLPGDMPVAAGRTQHHVSHIKCVHINAASLPLAQIQASHQQAGHILGTAGP